MTMLKTKLIHPEIMAALSLCGHGSKVLIADGNYPLAEKSGNAQKVYLGLCPGTPTVTQVLEAVMKTPDGSEPEIYPEFKKELPDLDLTVLGQYEFYDACMAENVVQLAISTGEKRTYANILLTIGCA